MDELDLFLQWFASNGSFRTGAGPVATKTVIPSGTGGRRTKEGESVIAPFSDSLSGNLQTAGKFASANLARGLVFEASRNHFSCGSGSVRRRPCAELRRTICRITDRSVRAWVCIISRLLRMSRSAVSQTLTGEFIPRPGLPGSGSWRTKTYKSYSPASAPMPQGSPSATEYFCRPPTATTARCVLTSNTST